jgi:3-dehydroquinate dehydratase-1
MKRPLICVSTYGEDLGLLSSRISLALKMGADLVEARLDYLRYVDSAEVSAVLKPYASKTVITLRPVPQGGRYTGDEAEKVELLKNISGISPAYVDLELELQEREALRLGCPTIVSWHDFRETPSSEKLADIAEECLDLGDIAKIVTYARERRDVLKVLDLYHLFTRGRVVAFCMGDIGRISRFLAMAAGSPISYASLPGLQTAQGQPTLEELKSFRSRLLKSVSIIYESPLLSNR